MARPGSVVALVLLFLTRPLQYLPRCVLGGIVFVVAVKLIDLRGLWSIRRESPGEYGLAVTTAAVVVLAMVLSLLRIVQHSYHPHTAVLKQDESGLWQLTPVMPGAVTEPGLVVFRFGAALFYANAGRFSEQIRLLAGPSPSTIHWIVVDAGAITHVDYTAARIVRELIKDLSQQEVQLAFAHVESDLTPDLDRHHITEAVGREHIFPRLHEAIAAYKAAARK